MQDLEDTIKRPNLQIFGTNEGAKVENKSIDHLFTKTKVENFPNLGKGMDTQVKEALRTPHRHDW